MPAPTFCGQSIAARVKLDVEEADIDWFDLRNMLLVARAVTMSALARGESRGAHQREDLPGMLSQWRLNQVARLESGGLALTPAPVVTPAAAQ